MKSANKIVQYLLGGLLDLVRFSDDDDFEINMDEVWTYYLEGPVCVLLRHFGQMDYLVIDGFISVLERQLAFLCEQDLFSVNKQLTIKLIQIMINCHLSKERNKCYFDKSRHESLEKVFYFCIRACGYTGHNDISMEEAIRMQKNHSQHGPNARIPSDEIDEMLQELLKFLVPEKGPAMRPTRDQGREAYIREDQSPLHMAAAFLYLPKTTRKLLDHFGVNRKCYGRSITEPSNSTTALHLLVSSLCLDVYQEKSFNATLECILRDNKFRIFLDGNIEKCIKIAFGLDQNINSRNHIQAEGIKKERIQVIFDIIQKLVVCKSVPGPEFRSRVVFTLVECFPAVSRCSMIDAYSSVMKTLMDHKDFDINRRFPFKHGYLVQHLKNFCEHLLDQGFHKTCPFPFELALLENFDPGLPDEEGNTILHLIILNIKAALWNNLIRMLQLILKHHRSDISLQNRKLETPVDVCLHLYKDEKISEIYFFELIHILTNHSTSSSEIIHDILSAITKIQGTDKSKKSERTLSRDDEIFFNKCYHESYAELVDSLLANNRFEINRQNEDMETIAHIAAKNSNTIVLDKLVAHTDFNPNIKNSAGDTPIFIIVQNFQASTSGKIIRKFKDKIDTSIENEAGQRLVDLMECQKSGDTIGLKRIMGFSSVPGTVITANDITRPPIELDSHDIKLHWMSGQTTDNRSIKTTTKEAMNEVIQKEARRGLLVYELNRPRKGKVCIISIHRFQVPWLQTLDGYSHDRLQLQQLWQEIGFQVYMPRTVQPYDDNLITAQEIECAVRKFAESLEADDSCAVLCILSHGGNGFVYGVDGKRVSIKRITSYLNNENCPHMMDKPKVVIIQACNGDKTDSGVLAAGTSTSEVIPAARQELLPSISDTIIIHPSQPEFVSYVYRTPGEGSVLIKHLTQIFREYAATEDIHTLLTRINKEVSDLNLPHVPAPGMLQEYKQMPEFRSSMRRLLYFFPLSAEEPRSPDIRMEDGAHDVTDEMMDVSGGNNADVTSAIQISTSGDVINDVHKNKKSDLSSDVKGIPFSDVTVPVACDPKDEHTDEKQQRTLRTSLKRQRSDSPGDDKAKLSKQ